MPQRPVYTIVIALRLLKPISSAVLQGLQSMHSLLSWTCSKSFENKCILVQQRRHMVAQQCCDFARSEGKGAHQRTLQCWSCASDRWMQTRTRAEALSRLWRKAFAKHRAKACGGTGREVACAAADALSLDLWYAAAYSIQVSRHSLKDTQEADQSGKNNAPTNGDQSKSIRVKGRKVVISRLTT
jgi:hypothetical protein